MANPLVEPEYILNEWFNHTHWSLVDLANGSNVSCMFSLPIFWIFQGTRHPWLVITSVVWQDWILLFRQHVIGSVASLLILNPSMCKPFSWSLIQRWLILVQQFSLPSILSTSFFGITDYSNGISDHSLRDFFWNILCWSRVLQGPWPMAVSV